MGLLLLFFKNNFLKIFIITLAFISPISSSGSVNYNGKFELHWLSLFKQKRDEFKTSPRPTSRRSNEPGADQFSFDRRGANVSGGGVALVHYEMCEI